MMGVASLAGIAQAEDIVKAPITAAVFAPDGKRVLLGSQAGVEVRSWPELKTLRQLAVRLDHVHDLAFSPKGDVLVAVGGSPGEEGVCQWLTWHDGKELRRETPHTDLVTAAAWSDDGALATASSDAFVRVFDSETQPGVKNSRQLSGHARGVLAVAFLPGGKKLVSGGLDQALRVWDVESGREERSLTNHTAAIMALAVRPTPRDEEGNDKTPAMIATIGRDKTLRLWQPTVGRMVRFARLPVEPVSLAWIRDGRAIAAGCVDGRVRVIDPESVKVLHDLPAIEGWVYSLACSPEGDAMLAAGERGQVVRVAIPTGK